MRVLYLLRYWPTLTETFVYREITELSRRGVQVWVAALGPRDDGRLQDEAPDVTVWYVPRGTASVATWAAGVGAVRHPAALWLARQQGWRHASRAAWLAGRVRRYGIDRIHAHFAGAGAEYARTVSALTGVPYGVTVHAADLFKPRASLTEVLADASPAIVVAEHHRTWLQDRYGLASTVVRCGVEIDRYPRADPAGEGVLRLVSVGRWVPKKGLDTLLGALGRVTEAVSLRMVSEVPASVSLPRGVEAGALPPSAVPAVLGASHAFVLPCRIGPDGDRDGLPVAIVEAMACGLPVITTPVAGIPELVDDEVGWMVAPDDEAGLAAVIDEVARSRAVRAQRGAAAHARVVARDLTVRAQVDALMGAWA